MSLHVSVVLSAVDECVLQETAPDSRANQPQPCAGDRSARDLLLLVLLAAHPKKRFIFPMEFFIS